MTVPYYADDKVTLYLGDCRGVPEWLAADVLVTDPPYGIGLDPKEHMRRRDWIEELPAIEGDDEPFDPKWILDLGKPTALWGANHYASRLPDARGWIAWDKATRNHLDLKQAEIEFGWTNFLTRPKCFRHMWSGAFKATERGERYHIAQKPVALLEWLIGLCPPGSIADPFAGSGSTLIAARNLGRRAVGVELEERHCEVIAKRLAQDCLDLDGAA